MSIQDIYHTLKQYGISEDQVIIPQSLSTHANQYFSLSGDHLSPSVHQTIIHASSSSTKNKSGLSCSNIKNNTRRSQSPHRRSARYVLDYMPLLDAGSKETNSHPLGFFVIGQNIWRHTQKSNQTHRLSIVTLHCVNNVVYVSIIYLKQILMKKAI